MHRNRRMRIPPAKSCSRSYELWRQVHLMVCPARYLFPFTTAQQPGRVLCTHASNASMSSYISKHPALTWKESCSLSIHHHACVYTVAWHTTAQCVPVCGLPWTAHAPYLICVVPFWPASIDQLHPSSLSPLRSTQHASSSI